MVSLWPGFSLLLGTPQCKLRIFSRVTDAMLLCVPFRVNLWPAFSLLLESPQCKLKNFSRMTDAMFNCIHFSPGRAMWRL